MMFNQVQGNEDINKVVRLTNKTDFDFTPEMGARFGGVPYFIQAGKSMLAPKPVAKLLAKHLARQVFLRQAPIRDERETDGKGSTRALWTEEQALRLADTFLSDEYAEERAPVLTEAEIMDNKIKMLNETFPQEEDTATTKAEVAPTYVDKQDVIKALTEKGIRFDARMTKANLEKLLE